MNIQEYFNFKNYEKGVDNEKNQKIYNMWEYCFWGNSIIWLDFDKRIITGHLMGIKKGDEIRAKMQSGKIAKYKIIDIEYKENPQDQFFAYLSDVGYLK